MTQLRLIACVALALLLALALRLAYDAGGTAEAARQAAAREKLQGQLFDLADRHDEAAAEMALLRATQDTDLREFENAARANPGAGLRVPDTGSLRELEDLWRRARTTP